jgi:hypothetical protein
MHNREQERSQLQRKLEAGVSIHMPAPRRIGKTWTMRMLAGDLRVAGWVAVEADVEGLQTPQEFARELCVRIEAQSSIASRFKSHVSQRFGNLLGGGWGDKPLDALGKVDPIQFAETLVASLHDSGERTVIIVDEISYFFLALAKNDAGAAHQFAYQLRALQQRYRNVRWLISGSIGLDTIARRYDLGGAFVDFEIFVLSPFTAEEARSYMRDPAIQQQFNYGFEASNADFEAMFATLGWLAPYYLKMIGNEVRPSAKTVATATDFDAAFERLLQPNRRSEFAVWREHISKNLLPIDRGIAEGVLGFLSKRVQGEKEDTLLVQVNHAQGTVTIRQLREILAMLVNDGLLAKQAGRYGFRSGLVRRYWAEYEAE